MIGWGALVVWRARHPQQVAKRQSTGHGCAPGGVEERAVAFLDFGFDAVAFGADACRVVGCGRSFGCEEPGGFVGELCECHWSALLL